MGEPRGRSMQFTVLLYKIILILIYGCVKGIVVNIENENHETCTNEAKGTCWLYKAWTSVLR